MKWSHSVWLLCPWDFPGKNTGVGCHFLLQKIFPTQGLNPGLPYCRQTLYRLSHQGSPTAKLQLSFIWRAKDSIPWRHNLSWFPLFICFVSSPLSLPYANWASQEGGVFVPPKVFTLVCGFSFVLFSQAFPFLCFLATAILDSFPLF